jgi:hypothetical protein
MRLAPLVVQGLGLAVLLFLIPVSRAQESGLLYPTDATHRFLEQQYTAGRLAGAHLLHRPLSAEEAARYLDSLDQRPLPEADQRVLDALQGRRLPPLATAIRRSVPHLYRNGLDLVSAGIGDRILHANPHFLASFGAGRRTGRDRLEPAWLLSRGIRLSGRATPYLFFDLRLTATDERALQMDAVDAGLGAHAGTSGQPYPRSGVTGVAGFRSRFFEVRAGRERNLWGPGQGSVVLSDYAAEYDHLQIRTSFWRIQYVNLFARLSSGRMVAGMSDPSPPPKYAALHQLSVDLPGRVQVGLFETVVFAGDTLGARRGFDVAYANPLVFYRAVERDRGSPDNMMLGGSLSWVATPGLRAYGQFLLDELKVNEIGKGWWGNKWGWILGLHVVDLPVQRLSLRAELARLRPYLYSHWGPGTNFVHHDQGLGHPAGPNAVDITLLLDYEPVPGLHAALRGAFTRRGRNTPDLNYGSDPNEPYTTRVGERGLAILQGVRQKVIWIEARAGYALLPRVFIEATMRAVTSRDALDGAYRYVLPAIQVRSGLPSGIAR